MGGIPSSRWLAPRVASPELRPFAPPGERFAPLQPGSVARSTSLELPLPLADTLASPRLPSVAGFSGTIAPVGALQGATALPAGPVVRGALELSDAAALPADGAPVSVEPAQPAPHPAGDSTLVERVFLAADSLGERLARTMPAERNGGQYGALLLIDSGAAPTRAQRDTLIERLASSKRHEDWLGNSSGGHYALILTQLGYRAEWAARRTAEFAARLIRGPAGRDPRLPRIAVGVTLLAPVASIPGDDANAVRRGSGLVAVAIAAATGAAESALILAREAADGEVRFSDPAINTMLRALGTMDRDLREAVDAGRFVIQFQPIVDRNGRLDRAEALVRWRHGNGDLIAADRFFDRAEALGLAVPIGYQVLEMVIRQLAFWSRDQRLRQVRIAVNLSASQLGDRHLVARLKQLFQTFDVAPSRLALELSESVVALASEDSIRRLGALHELGCRLSIDGFGRGWLTWSRIRQLPLRELKLPIASAAGVGQAGRLAGFAQEIGLDVTATRIETREQWRDAMRARFCAYQGHLIGRPSASTIGLLAQLHSFGDPSALSLAPGA